MKKTLLFIYTFIAMFALSAGEFRNLLLNPEFRKPAPDGFPLYWMTRDHSDAIVLAFDKGGPQNGPFIRLKCKRADAYLRQNCIHLVPGEKYIFSAWFRSRDLKGKMSGIRLSPGTEKDFLTPPPNQKEWLFIQKEYVFDKEVPKGHEFFLQIDNQCGELDVARVCLRATTEAGDKGARNQREQMTPSLVPLTLLNFIPRSRPRLDFFWIGKAPAEPRQLECVFSIAGDSQALTLPFVEGTRMTLHLDCFAKLAGEQKLVAYIRQKKTREVLHKQEYTIRFWDIPAPKGEQLNNLVTLLQKGQLKAGSSFKVVNHRLGWVYFHYKTAAGQVAALTLNGQPLTAPGMPANYAVRYLEPGVYLLKNVGADAVGETKLIPDILMFPLGNTAIPGNNWYDWNFAKQYMLPGLTTINVSGLNPIERKEMKQLGLRHLSNFGVLNPKKPNDAQDLVARLSAFKDLRSDFFEGTTMDEVEYWDGATVINPYVAALKEFANSTNKIIQSWVIGPPSPAYCDYISTACNISNGHGRVLYEVYNRSQYTEEEAKNYYEENLVHGCLYRDIAPDLFPCLSIILGNFSLPPLRSLDQMPRVDFRYALDLQMNALANDPRLMGLNGIGYWGTQNCDEETLRWCFALVKHYAINGKKEMLSSHYGFTYHNTLLQNPDFEDGLAGWQKSGDVTTGKHSRYGASSLALHGSAYPVGDTFAILAHTATAPAELRQKIKGLIPGKKYSIFYVVSNYDDIIKGINQPRRHKLEMTITDSEFCHQAYYVDDRNRPSLKARVNTRKIVFVPSKSEVELIFSTCKADSGQRFALNFITLRPYFDK